MVLTLNKENVKKVADTIPAVKRITNRFILEILLILLFTGLIAGYLIHQMLNYVLLLVAVLLLAGYSYIRFKKEGF